DENRFGNTIRRHPSKHQIVKDVLRFPKLRRINLRKARLGYVPNVVESTHLEFIDLSCNSLQSVPLWIYDQPSLTHLNLGANAIKHVPDLDDLPIRVLKLHKNIEIQSLPKLGKEVESLNLFFLCRLMSIPDEILDLK